MTEMVFTSPEKLGDPIVDLLDAVPDDFDVHVEEMRYRPDRIPEEISPIVEELGRRATESGLLPEEPSAIAYNFGVVEPGTAQRLNSTWHVDGPVVSVGDPATEYLTGVTTKEILEQQLGKEVPLRRDRADTNKLLEMLNEMDESVVAATGLTVVQERAAQPLLHGLKSIEEAHRSPTNKGATAIRRKYIALVYSFAK